VPDGKGPFPALIVVFYDADSGAGLNKSQVNRTDWGLQFAKRGFVTLSLGGPNGGPKTVQPLSWLAYCAMNANTFLRARPEVDPARVGVIGHSFGGKWAMFASCLDERFACAVWCDPGIVWNEKDANANYWEPWYLGLDPALPAQRKPGVPNDANPRTGAYKRLVAEGRDLTDLHALMAPRPFLVSGGAQDRPEHWTALNRAIALYKFLGHEGCIGMTMREGHGPTSESNAQVVAFFEHFLKSSGSGK
jgi:dienelactone hydrolase